MKVSLNWLKKYVPVELDNAAYESRMIMTGTGVEGMEDMGRELQNVVVGRVLTCEDHPNSDHLHICTVDVGEEAPLQIVCGAPNVKAGLLVPVAKVGAVLPGDFHIKKGKLRGVESCGMLCSSTEMNVPVELYPSVGDAGLLIFNEDYPVGTDVREIFGFNDTVVDFEILANRPDCLCVWGVARETAAALNAPLSLPVITVKEADGDIHDYADITVEDTEHCPRYAARVIKNVRIAPSPMWLRQYLHAAGMRSINNIVDITNFVMLETGHPMHAFDLAKVKGRKIVVRASREDETLTTLDGKEYALSGQELMICDEDHPTGLAGIMGGEESEITEETRDVLFECASFDRTSIRLTARRLGIRTEASGRFERGVSPATVMEALQRACQMVNELDAGDVVPGVIDIYPNPVKPAHLNVPVDYINKRTGVTVSGEEMKRILEKLFFEVELKDGVLHVTAPNFRQDIEQMADISEEVLRYAGYEHIPSTGLRGETTQGGLNVKTARHFKLQDMLSGMGAYECMNYSFISRKVITQMGFSADDARLNPVCIRNPLGEDTACMRTTLLCGVFKTVSTNQRGGNEDGRIYELGSIYDSACKTEENLPVEHDTLAIAIWGGKEDFYSLRGMVEAIMRDLGVCYHIEMGRENYLHPGRRAQLVAQSGDVICQLGQVHPDTAEAFDMNDKTYVCELDVEKLFENANALGHVQPIYRTPAVSRDLAFVMDGSVQLGPVMDEMKKACGDKLEDIRLFDVFRGVQVGEGKKSCAFNLVLRAKDHTLTEDEINASVKKAIKAAEKFGAVLRG
ncbi:MAG: phenylalanine--tRNA ligase subunit beta [Clostridiales bacterium]|nr:phenylalanine--tRNA ligase subunit beta [Clostridiales bacterium]